MGNPRGPGVQQANESGTWSLSQEVGDGELSPLFLRLRLVTSPTATSFPMTPGAQPLQLEAFDFGPGVAFDSPIPGTHLTPQQLLQKAAARPAENR